MGNSPHCLAPFFRTRQSANILEDLARLMRKPASIGLVHGLHGVGKTRLLNQFIHTRCSGRPIILGQFAQHGHCEIVVDQTPPQSFDFSVHGLNELPADAILLLDDFQFSGDEARHALFDYWQAHALARKQNLVIAGDQNVADALRDPSLTRAQHIDSVMLAPLNFQESLDFLSQHMCPDDGQVISLSHPMRRQIKNAGGLFGSLELLAQQPWPKLRCIDRAQQNGPAGAVVAKAVSAIALMVIIAYALLDGRFMRYLNAHWDDSGMPDVAQRMPAGGTSVDSHDSLSSETFGALQAVSAETGEAVHVSQAEAGEVIRDPAPRREHQPAAVTKSDLGPAVSSTTTPPSTPPARSSATTSLLQTRMQATNEWLSQSPPEAATIQIMTLIKRSAPEAAMRIYLERLIERGFDLESVYVYRVTRKGVYQYVVLYGEYADRGAALDAIDSLPDMLKRNGPLPRTVQGLRNEIAR